jgi:hypothetical protein
MITFALELLRAAYHAHPVGTAVSLLSAGLLIFAGLTRTVLIVGGRTLRTYLRERGKTERARIKHAEQTQAQLPPPQDIRRALDQPVPHLALPASLGKGGDGAEDGSDVQQLGGAEGAGDGV